MLMTACPACHGFPEFNAATGGVLGCCYLADIRALNLWSEQTDAQKVGAALWDVTRDYRAAKWAEYAQTKAAFAQRERAPVGDNAIAKLFGAFPDFPLGDDDEVKMPKKRRRRRK